MFKQPNLPTPGVFEPGEYFSELVYNSVVRALRDLLPQQPQPQREAQPVPEWGSRHDASVIAGVSLPTIHALIDQGLIVARKVGRRTLINLSDLREKLASGEISKYKRLQK